MRIDFKPPTYHLHLDASNWSLPTRDPSLAEALSGAATGALNRAWTDFRDGKDIEACVADANGLFARSAAGLGPVPAPGAEPLKVFGTVLESLFERGARAVEAFRRDMDGNDEADDQGTGPVF